MLYTFSITNLQSTSFVFDFIILFQAVHLIRAISVLLHFSPDEQKMLHDTLEYRMSWFGIRPALGSGQKSKYIPPPF